MTRADFIDIGNVLKNNRPKNPNQLDLWLGIAEGLTFILKRDNNKFDKSKFIEFISGE